MSDDKDFKVSNLSFSEMCAILLQLNFRTEAIWQRVVYIHAAMIGVMVFFSETEGSYTLARLLVFAFYTVNLLIAFFNLREIYRGLTKIQGDMRRFPEDENQGDLYGWLLERNYTHKTVVRATILTVAWALVGLLMFFSFG